MGPTTFVTLLILLGCFSALNAKPTTAAALGSQSESNPGTELPVTGIVESSGIEQPVDQPSTTPLTGGNGLTGCIETCETGCDDDEDSHCSFIAESIPVLCEEGMAKCKDACAKECHCLLLCGCQDGEDCDDDCTAQCSGEDGTDGLPPAAKKAKTTPEAEPRGGLPVKYINKKDNGVSESSEEK